MLSEWGVEPRVGGGGRLEVAEVRKDGPRSESFKVDEVWGAR